jgi:integrase
LHPPGQKEEYTVDDVKRFVSTAGLAGSSAASYERVLNKLAADCGNLAALDAGGLRDWLFSHDSWGQAMIWMALCAARAFLRWRYGVDHPALLLRIKRGESAPQRVLKRAQVQRLLESFDTSTAKGRRDLALCALMLDSGLRSAEVCRLEASRLDLEERRLTVAVKGGRWAAGVFSAYTANLILAWLADRESLVCSGERALFVGIGGKTPGKRMDPGGLRAVMRGWAKAAGLQALSPHDLRRTFATLAIRLGAPSRVVQAAGRWSSLEMVEHYTQSIEAADMEGWFPVEGALNRNL